MNEQSFEQEASLQVSDNGPLLLRGPVKIIDMEGDEIESDRKNVALCRCGRSGTRPFCDGTHHKIGFESVIRSDEGKAVEVPRRKAG